MRVCLCVCVHKAIINGRTPNRIINLGRLEHTHSHTKARKLHTHRRCSVYAISNGRRESCSRIYVLASSVRTPKCGDHVVSVSERVSSEATEKSPSYASMRNVRIDYICDLPNQFAYAKNQCAQRDDKHTQQRTTSEAAHRSKDSADVPISCSKTRQRRRSCDSMCA